MIHAESLTKYFDDLCAVDHIGFDIQKGEIVGLLGPNGAGKTTTLRMLTCFFQPSSGTIRIKDYDTADNSLEIKKLIGYLPESAPLYYDMLVYDYLNYIANIRGLESERKNSQVHNLADLCGINEVMHKPINELSKGYKQRVGLAHAMMDDPEILIMDEPTSGLDPNQRVEIRDIIKRIGKEKTVILSTHILSEAEATCDRMLIINQGKIVADDNVATLKQSAGGETLIYLSLKNTDFESVKTVLGSIDMVDSIKEENIEEDIVHLSLINRSRSDLREEIYSRIKQTDWILLELHQETQTLENIFMELTKES
ncbi:ABC transporter ATP-binding protein [Thermodesulfobacteriota bacterium]